MTPGGILETAIYADDLDAAERFYRDVIGLPVIHRQGDRNVFFRCGEAVLLVFNPDETVKPPAPDARLPVPPHGTRGQGHVCFRSESDEIERWKRHLELSGVAIEAELEWPQGGRSIYFRDPAGNSIEFAEPRIWGL